MQIKSLLFILASVLVIIGALFKIMHWPYANEIRIIGLITGFMALYFVFNENKKLKQRIKELESKDGK